MNCQSAYGWLIPPVPVGLGASDVRHHRTLVQYLWGSLPSSNMRRRCPEMLGGTLSGNKICAHLTFMTEERQNEDARGLAGRIKHIESLGLGRRSGDVGGAKPRKRKLNRIRPLRVCCSVCHDEDVESAPDRVRMTCQHLLHRKCLEYLVRHCSKEAGLWFSLCLRDILPIHGASSQPLRSWTTSLNCSVHVLSTNICVFGTSQVASPGNPQELNVDDDTSSEETL